MLVHLILVCDIYVRQHFEVKCILRSPIFPVHCSLSYFQINFYNLSAPESWGAPPPLIEATCTCLAKLLIVHNNNQSIFNLSSLLQVFILKLYNITVIFTGRFNTSESSSLQPNVTRSD